MLRLLRLLPVLIPIVSSLLRNPKVRSLLRMKPLDDSGSSRRKR